LLGIHERISQYSRGLEKAKSGDTQGVHVHVLDGLSSVEDAMFFRDGKQSASAESGCVVAVVSEIVTSCESETETSETSRFVVICVAYVHMPFEGGKHLCSASYKRGNG
jgi:hypothetical protein